MQPLPNVEVITPEQTIPAAKIRQIAFTYGLYIGMATILFVLLEFILGFHNQHIEIGSYTGYLAMILPIALIWFGIREIKSLYPNTKLPISKGLGFSLLASTIAGALLGVFMFIYIKWVNPEFVQLAAEMQAVQLRADGYTEEQVISALTNFFVLFNPVVQGVIAFIGAIIQGLLIGFVITLIQRRR